MTESLDVGIDGVTLLRLVPHGDQRGSFTEVYRQEWLPGTRQMLQSNLSLSRANVLRGLHFHRDQADYWCVTSGAALVGLYDLRSGSATVKTKAEIRMNADEERLGLYIPPGVAHGFYAETDVALQYLVDQYFSGDDEFGVAWDDSDAAIDWPTDDPILSERDRNNPSLVDVLQDAPSYRS